MMPRSSHDGHHTQSTTQKICFANLEPEMCPRCVPDVLQICGDGSCDAQGSVCAVVLCIALSEVGFKQQEMHQSKAHRSHFQMMPMFSENTENYFC